MGNPFLLEENFLLCKKYQAIVESIIIYTKALRGDLNNLNYFRGECKQALVPMVDSFYILKQKWCQLMFSGQYTKLQ